MFTEKGVARVVRRKDMEKEGEYQGIFGHVWQIEVKNEYGQYEPDPFAFFSTKKEAVDRIKERTAMPGTG